MKDFKDEWDALFAETVIAKKKLASGERISTNFAEEIFINKKKLVSGSKTIIDDIILWCSNLELILIYFECVCKVFQKYRVSFRLDKCEFLKDRVEYVSHDILQDGNAPAASKFDMINN